MLWGTQLPTFKKLTLVVVFSGAMFVMAAAIVRSIVIFQVRHPPLFKQNREYNIRRWLTFGFTRTRLTVPGKVRPGPSANLSSP